MGQDHKAALHINATNSGWTPARVDRLTELWFDGWSASQIGRDLKITRNSVIGMVTRRGLKRSSAAAPAKLQAPPVARARNQNSGLAFGTRTFTAPRVEYNAPAFYPLLGSTPRPWTTRVFGECAWPVGDGEAAELHHCCNPVSARGWCAEHFARGVQTPKPAKPQGAAKEGATVGRRRWAA